MPEAAAGPEMLVILLIAAAFHIGAAQTAWDTLGWGTGAHAFAGVGLAGWALRRVAGWRGCIVAGCVLTLFFSVALRPNGSWLPTPVPMLLAALHVALRQWEGALLAGEWFCNAAQCEWPLDRPGQAWRELAVLAACQSPLWGLVAAAWHWVNHLRHRATEAANDQARRGGMPSCRPGRRE